MRRYTPSPPPPSRRRTTIFTDAAAAPPPPSRRRYDRSSPAATRRRRLVTRTRPEHQYPSATQPAATYADDFRTWERLPPPPPRRARSRSREPVVIRERVEYVDPDRRRRRSGGERLGFGAPDVRAGVPAQTYAQEEDDDEDEEEDVRVRWPAEFGGGAGWLGWEDRAGMRYDDFALSRRDRGVFGVLAAEDEEEKGDGEGEKELVEEVEERADETRLRVRFSEWLENGSGGEDPVAELVVEPDVGVMRKVKGKKGLFEWLHLKQDVMSFEAFTRRTEKACELNDEQKKWVVKLLKGISRQFEKPLLTQQGIQGRWMIPNFDQELRDGSSLPTVDFLCFPYFTLEKYGPPTLPENSKAHPKRTLLQTLFSSASRAQDFQQAVTQLPNTPKDYLFHVRQLWALIVDDKFMITCSSKDCSGMAQESINITSQPSFGISSASSAGPGYIEVSDGGLNVWLLPLDQCRTWFLFRSNLYSPMFEQQEGLEDGVEVTFEGTALSEEDWPRVLEKAQKTSVHLEVRRSTARLTMRMPAVIVAAETEDDSETLFSETFEEALLLPEVKDSKGQFHVFTWLSNMDGKSDMSTRLHKALEEVQKLLLKESHPKDRKAYRTAFIEGKRKKQSYESMQHALEILPTDTKEEQEWQKYMTRVVRDFATVFQFFLPLGCNAPVACCFWAAVHRIVEAPMTSEPPQANELATYATSLSEMSQRLSGLEIPRPSRDNPPDNFVIAWIHISLAVCHWNTDDMTAFDHHLESFAQKIAAAWPKFLRSFQDRPLEERTAAMPLSILSLLTQELLMDFTGMRPDVMASYWDYYNQLNRRVDEDPLNRVHQKSINFLKQEIEAIKAVLNQQLNVLNDFNRALDQRSDAAASGGFSDLGYSVEPIIVSNCIAAVEAKLRSFEDMRLAAANLQTTNLQMIDSNKDRQEAAVYAFTIVTIIFLPLSFVSGFLGMNTVDIRDMPYQQWVFWAAAIPLTVLIILLGLIWAGELGNAWRGCLGMLDGRKTTGGMGRHGDGVRPFANSKSMVDGPGGGEDEEIAAPRRARGGLVRRGTLASRR